MNEGQRNNITIEALATVLGGSFLINFALLLLWFCIFLFLVPCFYYTRLATVGFRSNKKDRPQLRSWSMTLSLALLCLLADRGSGLLPSRPFSHSPLSKKMSKDFSFSSYWEVFSFELFPLEVPKLFPRS